MVSVDQGAPGDRALGSGGHVAAQGKTYGFGAKYPEDALGASPGFSSQALCADEQLILAGQATTQDNDQGLFHPMLTLAQEPCDSCVG